MVSIASFSRLLLGRDEHQVGALHCHCDSRLWIQGWQMKPDLDAALCRDFPLLCLDRNASMQESCFHFGFTCGDGWEPLIRRLCNKLEPMVQALQCHHPMQRQVPCQREIDALPLAPRRGSLMIVEDGGQRCSPTR